MTTEIKEPLPRRDFLSGEIDLMQELSQTNMTFQQITDAVNSQFEMNRIVKSIIRRMQKDGMVYSVSDCQRSIEDDNYVVIDEYWDGIGYIADLKRNTQGEVRSNMTNGLPKAVVSAKKYWAENGLDNFKKIIKQRRKDGCGERTKPK